MSQTASEERELLWSQVRYDSGLYLCKVQRGDSTGGGMLSITLVGNISHLIHEEAVKTDRLDENKWRLMCEQVINDPSKRSNGIGG